MGEDDLSARRQAAVEALAAQRAAMNRPRLAAELTDAGNADRIAHRWGDSLRYVPGWGWLTWGGTHWVRGDVHALVPAVETARSIALDAADCRDPDAQKAVDKWARRSQMAGSVNAALALARPLVLSRPEQFDAAPWVLTAANGTIDLRTGALRPHDREDYATRASPVSYYPPGSPVRVGCPTWLSFLERVLPDPEQRAFIQRAFGYSLTGVTRERTLFFLYGQGANGKSALVETLREILGDYQGSLSAETLMANDRGGNPRSLASLVGLRVAAVAETPESGRFDEARIKELTGDDTIEARFLYQEPFSFRPQAKLWIRGNHKPNIKGTDDGIWSRFALVPFAVQIPEGERDLELQQKLRGELPGILSWAVQGCLDWQRIGLAAPGSVRAAVNDYRSEMDSLADFLSDRCVVGATFRCAHNALYKVYQAWAEESGVRSMSSKKLSMNLAERRFERFHAGTERGWLGLGIAADGWA